MTPRNQVTLTIDGQTVSAPAGASLMEATDAAGLRVPRLCRLRGLSNGGACRLCLVEIQGSPRLQPSCKVTVRDEMVVTTQSERLARYRRMILELLFAERNHVCAVCVVNGHCELQALAQSLGMDHVRFPYRSPALTIDASHPRFAVDHNRCILCARCVRACGEIEGAYAQGVMGRGSQSLIIYDLAQPWGEALSCTSCGKCVQVCPTGALFEKHRAAAEMVKHPEIVAELLEKREVRL